MSKADNTRIWDQVCVTDPSKTKLVSYGRKFTSIDPTYQNHEATKLWGPQGIEWGLKNIMYDAIKMSSWDKEAKQDVESTTIIMKGLFFFPGGTIEMVVDAPFKHGQDTMKKLRTGMISKALSQLGFNADIFLGKFDDAQYVSELKDKLGKGNKAVDRLANSIPDVMDLAELDKFDQRAMALLKSSQIDGDSFDELTELIESRRAELLAERSE